MQGHPLWKSKPQVERFAEVERRVKADLELQPGSPNLQDKTPQKSTKEQIQKAIDDQAKGVVNLPETLSTLAGGTSADNQSLSLESLDKMDATQIAALGLTNDQLAEFASANLLTWGR